MHLGDHIVKKYESNTHRGRCDGAFYSTCRDDTSSVHEEEKCDDHALLNRASENPNPLDIDIIQKEFLQQSVN